MEKNAHFFYATRLPAEIKLQLNERCDSLKGLFPFSRWVHQEDYHITLAFLGNATDEMLKTSIDNVEKELKHTDFTLKINQLGVFGKRESPRIFWAGVEKEQALNDVRKSVFQACLNAGFKLETRPFSPHITLARKWKGETEFSIKQDPFRDSPIQFTATEVVLYRTHLDRVPKYEAVEVFPLKS